VLFALGGGVLYLATLLAVTLGWGESLPLLGWIGFAVASTVVFAAGTILAVFLVRSSTRAGSEPPQRRPRRMAGVHRVLVVADEGCSGPALCRPLAASLEGRRTEVLVVAPALLSPTHFLDSDLDAARAAAERRLAETVAAFEAAGVGARAEVGSESPLEAIADALAVFAADEIVVATPPPERANWLEEHVVERARAVYEQPVSHLVVEGGAPAAIRSR
jgi:GABA permease